jgi:hypothetical protein
MADLNEFMDGFVPENDGDFDKFEGRFHCVIDGLKIESEDGSTRASFTFKVKGPTRVGRLAWANCYLSHKNPKAVAAGKGTIHKIATAIGVPTTSGKDAYIGEELYATFKLSDDGKYQNLTKAEPYEPEPEASVPAASPSVDSADGEEFPF